MLFLKYMLLAGVVALFAVAIGIIASMVYFHVQNRRRPEGEREEISSQRKKHTFFLAGRISLAGFLCMLLAQGWVQRVDASLVALPKLVKRISLAASPPVKLLPLRPAAQ